MYYYYNYYYYVLSVSKKNNWMSYRSVVKRNHYHPLQLPTSTTITSINDVCVCLMCVYSFTTLWLLLLLLSKMCMCYVLCVCLFLSPSFRLTFFLTIKLRVSVINFWATTFLAAPLMTLHNYYCWCLTLITLSMLPSHPSPLLTYFTLISNVYIVLVGGVLVLR